MIKSLVGFIKRLFGGGTPAEEAAPAAEVAQAAQPAVAEERISSDIAAKQPSAESQPITAAPEILVPAAAETLPADVPNDLPSDDQIEAALEKVTHSGTELPVSVAEPAENVAPSPSASSLPEETDAGSSERDDSSVAAEERGGTLATSAETAPEPEREAETSQSVTPDQSEVETLRSRRKLRRRAAAAAAAPPPNTDAAPPPPEAAAPESGAAPAAEPVAPAESVQASAAEPESAAVQTERASTEIQAEPEAEIVAAASERPAEIVAETRQPDEMAATPDSESAGSAEPPTESINAVANDESPSPAATDSFPPAEPEPQTALASPPTGQPEQQTVTYQASPTQRRPGKMPRIVKCGLIQTSLAIDTNEPIDRIRDAQVEKTLRFVDQAGEQGVQILCMQEIFTGPYFCAEQNPRWYEAVEQIPDGPTTKLMQEYARKYQMVIIVPLYEEESTGVYYNTAAVIDADGTYLGKYRKNHIPHVAPGFWEKYYFRPGNLGYPVFNTRYAKVGVYICYDRHFPEGARELGLNGAEIVFNPSATVAGLSEYLWKLEQPAHAVANGYFIGAINRVGFEGPWNIGEFYGQSYFCDPRGQILAIADRDKDALVVAELDLDKIREVRNVWPFYRDRRPDTYNGLVKP